jgi:hypothetical protein
MNADAAAPEIVIKLAETADEREQIYRLRYETYVAEMNDFTSIVDHPTRRLTDIYDERSMLLAAYADGHAVGTLRLTSGVDMPFSDELVETYAIDTFFPFVAPDAMAVVSRFAVRETHRGTPTPFHLVVEALRIGMQRRWELLFCDCQPHLIHLWGSLGCRPYCPTYNHPGAGLLVPLVMILGDGDYLRQIGSPLLGTALDPDLPTSEVALAAQRVLPSKPPVRSLEHVKTYDWRSEIAPEFIEQALRVFENLDQTQFAEILRRSHIIDVGPDTYLIRQGQVTRTMYVLLGGELQYSTGLRRLANANIGEVVGDVAFFLKTSRTIDVKAGPAGARVLSLSERAVQTVMESHSRGAAILLFNLCRMLAARVAERTEEP